MIGYGGNTPTVSYTRGSDLSRSLEGAGGIGGLLARSHGYSAGNWSTHNFYHADGNGNITYLETSAQGLGASYRYDAFGNTTASSGSLAAANSYRFSSKEVVTHWRASGGALELYYYGYRWYAPNLQRWVNRDPLGDASTWLKETPVHSTEIEVLEGPNLYSFIGNRPIQDIDSFGLLRFHKCTVVDQNPIPTPIWKCKDGTTKAINGPLKVCVLSCFSKSNGNVNHNIIYVTRPRGWPCMGGVWVEF